MLCECLLVDQDRPAQALCADDQRLVLLELECLRRFVVPVSLVAAGLLPGNRQHGRRRFERMDACLARSEGDGNLTGTGTHIKNGDFSGLRREETCRTVRLCGSIYASVGSFSAMIWIYIKLFRVVLVLYRAVYIEAGCK